MTNKLPSAAVNATGAPSGEAQVNPSATPPPALSYDIRQQDGAIVTLTCRDTVHNRQFVDFVRRHEPFAEQVA